MNTQLEKIREELIARYDLDTNDAKFYFSTANYSFVFPDKPYMLRVSMFKQKSRQEMMSEVIWLDDLAAFSETLCTPAPSKNGLLIEEFEIDGEIHRATMFRTAKGNIRTPGMLDPMRIIAIGDCLGRIHAGSADAQKNGFRYKRTDWKSIADEYIGSASQLIPPELLARMESIVQRVTEIPQEPNNYGLIHGDFHGLNYLVDGNNIWVFDFDGCHYGFYMYDIACACLDCTMIGYLAAQKISRRDALYNHILPYLKIGYELHHKLPQEQWELLELFMELRNAIASASLWIATEKALIPNVKKTRDFLTAPLMQPSLLEGYDLVLQQQGRVSLLGKERSHDNEK